LGFNTGLTLDNRNHTGAPDSGYYGDVQGYLYPKIFSNPQSFGKVRVDLRYYFPYRYYTKLSLALRIKAEKVWGTYPFYESAFIGGISSVRGLPSERYSGNASLAGGVELRVKTLDVFFLFPEEVGVLAFIESGRVFLSDRKSRKWHTGFGGGLYCSVINKDLTFSLTLGSSEKRIGFYFNSGFTF
jgi:outer membrane protein assembly factor BamA